MGVNLAKFNKCETLSNGDVRTCWFRGAFVSVREFQKEMDEKKEPYRYGITMLFDKGSVDMAALKELCLRVAKAKWADKMPKGLAMPFSSGDEKYQQYEDEGKAEGREYYKGAIVAKATTKFRVNLVAPNGKEFPDVTPNEADPIYSGAYYRAVVSAWAYDVSGNKGVSLNLHFLQKLADGEVLGGGNRMSVEEAFGDSAVEDNPSINSDDWMGI